MISTASLRTGTIVLAFAATLMFTIAPASANDGGDWATARFKASDQARAPAQRSNLGRTSVSRDTSKSLSGSIIWQASASCVPSQLRGVLNDVASSFGPVRVSSTCRSASSNRAAGGASKSYHLSGQAVDFRVLNGSGGVYAHLARHSSVGGLKHYGGGLYHIDTGPRRSF